MQEGIRQTDGRTDSQVFGVRRLLSIVLTTIQLQQPYPIPLFPLLPPSFCIAWIAWIHVCLPGAGARNSCTCVCGGASNYRLSKPYPALLCFLRFDVRCSAADLPAALLGIFRRVSPSLL